MNDIIQDQRIHYIVKDYRRMFNNYWTLRAVIEEQEKSLNAKDKEILILRARINELKEGTSKPALAEIKNKFTDLSNRANSVASTLYKSADQLERNLLDIKELRQLLKQL